MKKLLLVLLVVHILNAQDFGYSYYNITDFRSLGISYNAQEFYPAGSNNLPDSLKIRFTSALPCIEYRELNVRVAVGYQSYTLGKKNLTSFSVNIESGNDFPITGREQRNGFFIPLKLSANYIKAENPYRGLKNFDIGSLGAGTGAKYRHTERTFGVQISGTGTLFFSNVGFGTEYGSQTSLVGEIQLILPELFFEGIIIGYRYEKQEWNMNDSALNYERFYHGPFIGIFF